MNILQVIPCFTPPILFGGSQRAVNNLSEGLTKRGHHVKIFTSNMANEAHSLCLPELENISGFEIHHFRNLSTALSRTTRLIVTPDIVGALLQNLQEVDVVHLHELRNFPQLATAYFSLIAAKPYVVQAHGTLPVSSHLRLKNLYDKTILRVLLEKADRVIAVSKSERNQYEAYGVSPRKIEIVPNAIDPDEFANLPPKGVFRSRYGISKSECVILYLGRIARDKGADVLVDAVSLMKRGHKNIRLVIVGPDDNHLKHVKELIRIRHMEARVVITGALYGTSRLAAYEDADIYALPSLYETFPLTMLEAYMCSKAVVASNIGDMNERIKHGVTGFLFRPGDAEELAHYLSYLADNPLLADKMGIEGRKMVMDQYSMDRVIDRIEEIYKEII
jgi:glycosyltransferase involved in cell wall biosynthesis